VSEPILLYQKAYELDYQLGELNKAKKLYAQIIEQFPEEEEAQYAQIHLDRIRKIQQSNQPQQQKKKLQFPFPLISVALSGLGVLLACIALFSAFIGWSKTSRSVTYQQLVTEGIIIALSGQSENAFKIFEDAKQMAPKKTLAYRANAELYYQLGDYQQALMECEMWRLVEPENPQLAQLIQRIKASLQQPVVHGGTE